jgi:DNA-directed RNA polymerase sigma subunit (sigma70/sigma32)
MEERIVHKDACRCQENPEEWKVNSPEHFNCFFTYMRHNSRPHTLNEIAKLLNMSIAAVTSIEKKALNKLKRKIAEFEKVKKLSGM